MTAKSLTTETLKESINPETLLSYYGFKHIRNYGDTLRACCAIHGGDNETGFVWNLSNNLWFCYTGDCGGGDAYDLVMKMENVDFKTAVSRIAELAGIDINEVDFHQKFDVINEQHKWLERQKKKTILNNNSEFLNDIPHKKYLVTEIENNLISNRFKPETFNYFNSYFARIYPTKERLYENKLVIPLKKNEIMCGVALRDFSGLSKPKWLYLPKGLKIGSILYNYEKAIEFADEYGLDELILVEGIFDVWAYHEAGIDNAVCVFGSSLSETQSRMILKTGLDVTLSFDNDEAGNRCTEKVKKMLKNKTEIKQIYIPSGCDPCDVDRDVLKSLYLKRK